MKKLVATFSLLSLCLIASPFATNAQAAYPERTITIVTQAGPGNGVDSITRFIAREMTKEFGQNVVVVNKPGAGGNLALNEMLGKKADGYTFATVGFGMFGTNIFETKPRYKYEDISLVSGTHGAYFAMMTNPANKWNTVKEAFEDAKKQNKTLKVSFIAAETRLIYEAIAKQEGVKIAIVPNQGSAGILSAMLGNHIDLGDTAGIELVTNTQGGKMKPLAHYGIPINALPNLTSLEEQGYDFAYRSRVGLVCSSSVPAEIRTKISDFMIKLGNSPEYKKELERLYIVGVPYGEVEGKKMAEEEYKTAEALSKK